MIQIYYITEAVFNDTAMLVCFNMNNEQKLKVKVLQRLKD